MDDQSRGYERDRRLVVLCWLTVLAMRLILLAVPYRRLSRYIPARTMPPPVRLTTRLEAAMLRASRNLPITTCLAEACAVRLLLAMKGFGATMRVGVRVGDGGRGMVAHAWLVVEERVILGSRIPGFDEFRPIADFA